MIPPKKPITAQRECEQVAFIAQYNSIILQKLWLFAFYRENGNPDKVRPISKPFNYILFTMVLISTLKDFPSASRYTNGNFDKTTDDFNGN